MKTKTLTVLLAVIVLTGATSFANTATDDSWNPNRVSKMLIAGKPDPNVKMTEGGVPAGYVWGDCLKCDRRLEAMLAAQTAARVKTVSIDPTAIRNDGTK